MSCLASPCRSCIDCQNGRTTHTHTPTHAHTHAPPISPPPHTPHPQHSGNVSQPHTHTHPPSPPPPHPSPPTGAYAGFSEGGCREGGGVPRSAKEANNPILLKVQSLQLSFRPAGVSLGGGGGGQGPPWPPPAYAPAQHSGNVSQLMARVIT